MTLPPAARYVVPYLRPFPIWKYGPACDLMGRYVRHEWLPDWYGTREITKAEAEQLVSER